MYSAKNSKDKWKWEIIAELLDGPLQNPAFIPALVRMKFFKRLLSFFAPEKHLFCDLSWSYVRLTPSPCAHTH